MKKRPDPELIDDDIPELDSSWFARARPAREVLPPEFFEGMEKLRRARGKQKAPLKKPVSLRLDSDVLRWFKERGRGYQAYINTVLRAHMQEQQ